MADQDVSYRLSAIKTRLSEMKWATSDHWLIVTNGEARFLLAELSQVKAENERLKAIIDDMTDAAEWQPIETAPKEEQALFWVIPKTPEEAYINTSGDSIFGTFDPYVFLGRNKTWNSLSKATHWMPLPEAPST